MTKLARRHDITAVSLADEWIAWWTGGSVDALNDPKTTTVGAVWRDPFYADAWRRFALRFRRRRFALVRGHLQSLGDRRLRILDVGGYEAFWSDVGFDLDRHEIVVLNLPREVRRAEHPNVRTVGGDACDMGQFRPGDFDVVFSNSVIEHVGTWERQQAMAREIGRLSRRYIVQTPSFWFPLEPHFHVPGFQWLPLETRTRLIQRHKLGLMPRFPDEAMARRCAEDTRLLTRREVAKLFPDARITTERLLGMAKSYVAVRWGP